MNVSEHAATKVFLLVVGAALSGLALTAPDAKLFGPAAQLETGHRPTFAVIAEVTGDAYADLLVVSIGSETLHVYAGSASGALAEGTSFAAGPNPESLALADFDEDGDADLVIANHETTQVTLLLNDGSGKFSPGQHSPVEVRVSPRVHAVVARDMDADGHMDIVADDRRNGGFILVRGRGDGRFYKDSSAINAGGDAYLGMAIQDLDSDGRPDIVGPLDNAVSVVMNKAAGFSEPTLLEGPGAFGVAVDDFDGDGLPDIASASEGGRLLVYKGTEKGVFEAVLDRGVRPGAKRIASGDFNADGHADLVLQNYLSPDLLIFPGGPELNGAGIKSITLSAGKTPWGLATGDLNADGRDDLVSLDHENDIALVFLARP